jgi:hypothetical protein
MLTFTSFRRRITALAGVASAGALIFLTLSTSAGAQTTAPAAPVIQLANPGAGDVLSMGDYVVTGTAYDPIATTGSGISHVDLFLGTRESGGTFLGSAVPGQDQIPNVTAGTRLAETGFQLTVTLPESFSGGSDLVAYAYSSETGQVVTQKLPVYIGVAPTPTPIPDKPLAALPVQEQPMAAPSTQGDAMFSLGNPSKGDVVLKGDYIVSGAAGANIDRVELFLGDREAGGTHLGTVVPVNGIFSANVTIPDKFTGGTQFCAYAYSSMTGNESEVMVPIYVGAPPTPTPRPA